MISYLIPKVEPMEVPTTGIVASGTIALETYDDVISKYNNLNDDVAQEEEKGVGGGRPSVEIVEFMPKCQLFPYYEAKLRYGKSEEERKDAYEKLLEHFSDIIVDEQCRQAFKSYILKPESDEEREAEERAILLEREKLEKEKEIEVIDLTMSSDDEDEDEETSIRVSTFAPESEPPVPKPQPSVPMPKASVPTKSQITELQPPVIFKPELLVSQVKPMVSQHKPFVSQPKPLVSHPKLLISQPELSIPTNPQVSVPEPPVLFQPEPLVPIQAEPLAPQPEPLTPQQATRRSTRVFVPSAKLINATVDNLSTVEQKLIKRNKQQQRNQQQKRTTQPKVQQPQPKTRNRQAPTGPRKPPRSNNPRILAMSEQEYAEYRRAINEKAKQKRAQLSEQLKVQLNDYSKQYSVVAALTDQSEIKKPEQVERELKEQQRKARLAVYRERERKRKAANPELVKAKKRLANLKYRDKMRLEKEAKQLAKGNKKIGRK